MTPVDTTPPSSIPPRHGHLSASLRWAETRIDTATPAANEPTRQLRIDPTQYVDFVRRVAHKMARTLPAHVSVDDLVGAGMLGLMDAVGRFDPAKGDRFESFAEFRIKGAILDELRRCDSMARNGRVTLKRIGRTRDELIARLGRPPEEDEMATAMHLRVDDYRKLCARVRQVRTLSLDALSSPDPERDGGRGLQLHANTPDVETLMQARETHEQLHEAIAALKDRHRLVLEMYYRREWTLKQIGARLGVTESRVCQILAAATSKLRALLDPAPRAKIAHSRRSKTVRTQGRFRPHS